MPVAEVNPETAEWIDGRGFTDWLASRGFETISEYHVGWHARKLRHWRNGKPANVYQVDAVLVKLGLHLSEVPPELYVDYKPAKGKRLPDTTRLEIARRLKSESATAIANKLGVDHKTVRRYAEAA